MEIKMKVDSICLFYLYFYFTYFFTHFCPLCQCSEAVVLYSNKSFNTRFFYFLCQVSCRVE